MSVRVIYIHKPKGERQQTHTRRTNMKKQTDGWGYGKEMYKTFEAFPKVLHFEGEDWYKMCECMTTNTGMRSAEYYAEVNDDSRRIYMDAAGNKTRD